MTFRILHTHAGAFSKGQLVTDKQIKESGADLSFWKQSGAVEEVKILSKTEADASGLEEEEVVSYQVPAPPVSAASIAAQAAHAAAAEAATKVQKEAQSQVAIIAAVAAKKAADKAAGKIVIDAGEATDDDGDS